MTKAKGTHYAVTYSVIGTTRPYADGKSTVFISDEYGTSFEDIRTLVAIPRGLKADNIVIKVAILVEK